MCTVVIAQVNTLVYSMGDEADDILRSFGFSTDDGKKYDVVKAKFDGHFVKRRNVIYERAQFNQRIQEHGESVDAFITALYGLVEHCGYAGLHDILVNVPARVHYRIECTRNASRANRARGAAECSIMHRDAFRVHSIR